MIAQTLEEIYMIALHHTELTRYVQECPANGGSGLLAVFSIHELLKDGCRGLHHRCYATKAKGNTGVAAADKERYQGFEGC